MLNQIRIVNDAGEFRDFFYLRNHNSGYLIQDIEGLDPVPDIQSSSSYARLDGEIFQSSRKSKRNMVFKIGLKPNSGLGQTVSALRHQLYLWMMPGTELTFIFYTDELPVVTIKGRVETFESSRFTKDPEVAIGIVCYDPDFVAQEETVKTVTLVTAATWTDIEYEGSVATGFTLRLASARNGFDITVAKGSNLQVQQIMDVEPFSFTPTFANPTVAEISTLAGNKYARMDVLGATTDFESGVVIESFNVLASIPPQSVWPELSPGPNRVRVRRDNVGTATYTIRYKARYGGI